MFEYKCKLIKVIDGDTIDVDIDLGFGVWLRKQRVRLYGIDTPESRTRDLEEKKRGLAAKARLIELLGDGKFILESHGVGKYGRCLGSLHMGSKNINKTLIKEGHATEYHGGAR